MKKTCVIVSGGFDPLHVGHVRLFNEAKKLGDTLIVFLNNDNWLMKKKGKVFMNEDDRAEIIRNIRCVDECSITKHVKDCEDVSVCEMLEEFSNFIELVNENNEDKTEISNWNRSYCSHSNCHFSYISKIQTKYYFHSPRRLWLYRLRLLRK